MSKISNDMNLQKNDLDFLINLYKKGEFQNVLNKSEEIILKYSNSMALHNLRGTVNAQLKRYDEAIKCYKDALIINPNNAITYNNLGNVFREKGDLTLTIKNYHKAISLRPNYSEAYYNIGIVYRENGNINLAKESFKNAISFKPKYAEAYNGLGLTLEKNGEFLSAIKNYEKALKINPNYSEVYFNLGNIFKKNGDFELSIINYKKAIKLKQNYSEAYCNLGNTKKDLGEINSAIHYYKKALKANPEDFETMWNLHGVSGSIDEATNWLINCLKAKKNCLKAKLTLSALKYLRNDKIDFNNLITTKYKSHPFMRSFVWFFQLPKVPKLFFDKFSFFNYAVKKSDRDRPFYEFGVWKGTSFKYLMKNFKKGFGFDTFTGLPERWYNEVAGTYSSNGVIPNIKGGEFIVGRFQETLPKFFKNKRPLASLINFDADLYSSTFCALENCKNIIDKNTIIIFDEFLMSDNWEEDEYKALNDFCYNNNFSYEVIAVSFFSKQVAVKIAINS